MHEMKASHPFVCFGETLWDLLPHAKLPGGAPMNVAYHLNKLQKNPAIISRIGCDELGKELINILESKDIGTSYIQVDYEYPTGKVFAAIKDDNEVCYDIVKPSAWDFIEWEDRFADLLTEAEYFVFGSLITRNNQSGNVLFNCLETAKVKVLDINLRPPYFNRKSIEELLRKADILKLNVAELHLITDWFGDYNNNEDRIKLLKDRFDISTIITTKGGDGAILHISDSFYYHQGYTVTVADTVGSGDSFLAAILSKLNDRAPPEEALDFASAVGAFVASCPGGCPEYNIRQVHALMNKREVKHF